MATIDSIRNFINEDNVKALMSRRCLESTFNYRVVREHIEGGCEEQCAHFECLWYTVSQNVRPQLLPNWQHAVIEEPEWKLLMYIIRDDLNEMDCVMIQQTLQSRTSQNKDETVKAE